MHRARDQGFHRQGCAHEDAEEYTLINAADPEKGARGGSQRVTKACEEQPVVVMNTPGQNVNDFAEFFFAMMLNSGLEVAGRSIAFCTIPF